MPSTEQPQLSASVAALEQRLGRMETSMRDMHELVRGVSRQLERLEPRGSRLPQLSEDDAELDARAAGLFAAEMEQQRKQQELEQKRCAPVSGRLKAALLRSPSAGRASAGRTSKSLSKTALGRTSTSSATALTTMHSMPASAPASAPVVATDDGHSGPITELGSLELFGDLYEGGHAGHNATGHKETVPLGVLMPWSRVLLVWDLICSSSARRMPHAHTRAHAHTCTRARTHTHAHTHACTHMHTRTHATA